MWDLIIGTRQIFTAVQESADVAAVSTFQDEDHSAHSQITPADPISSTPDVQQSSITMTGREADGQVELEQATFEYSVPEPTPPTLEVTDVGAVSTSTSATGSPANQSTADDEVKPKSKSAINRAKRKARLALLKTAQQSVGSEFKVEVQDFEPNYGEPEQTYAENVAVQQVVAVEPEPSQLDDAAKQDVGKQPAEDKKPANVAKSKSKAAQSKAGAKPIKLEGQGDGTNRSVKPEKEPGAKVVQKSTTKKNARPAPSEDDEPSGKRRKQDEKPPTKVFVGGLPPNTSADDLRECFSAVGPIRHLDLKMSYAFIDFESTESAALAVSRYHEGWFMENQIRVELSMHGKKPNLHPNVKSGPPPPTTAAASQACFKCGKPGHKIKDCRSQVDIRVPKQHWQPAAAPFYPTVPVYGPPGQYGPPVQAYGPPQGFNGYPPYYNAYAPQPQWYGPPQPQPYNTHQGLPQNYGPPHSGPRFGQQGYDRPPHQDPRFQPQNRRFQNQRR